MEFPAIYVADYPHGFISSPFPSIAITLRIYESLYESTKLRAMQRGEVLTGRRGGMLLSYMQHLYKRNRSTQNIIHWECYDKNCNVRLHTQVQNPDVIVTPPGLNHNHGPMIEEIDFLRIRHATVQAVRDDLIAPVPLLYENTLDHLENQNVVSGLYPAPDFNSLRSVLQRERNTNLPAIPTDVDDIDFTAIDRRWSRTVNQRRFLIEVGIPISSCL